MYAAYIRSRQSHRWIHPTSGERINDQRCRLRRCADTEETSEMARLVLV